MCKIYYDATEISEMLGISKATAYGIIKRLNEELEKAGYITISGKVSRTYFGERWYGGVGNEDDIVAQGA